jgi:hypothetical protein
MPTDEAAQLLATGGQHAEARNALDIRGVSSGDAETVSERSRRSIRFI